MFPVLPCFCPVFALIFESVYLHLVNCCFPWSSCETRREQSSHPIRHWQVSVGPLLELSRAAQTRPSLSPQYARGRATFQLPLIPMPGSPICHAKVCFGLGLFLSPRLRGRNMKISLPWPHLQKAGHEFSKRVVPSFQEKTEDWSSSPTRGFYLNQPGDTRRTTKQNWNLPFYPQHWLLMSCDRWLGSFSFVLALLWFIILSGGYCSKPDY